MADFTMNTDAVINTADGLSATADVLIDGVDAAPGEGCRSNIVLQAATDAAAWFGMSTTRTHGDLTRLSIAARSAANAQRAADETVARGATQRGAWLP